MLSRCNALLQQNLLFDAIQILHIPRDISDTNNLSIPVLYANDNQQFQSPLDSKHKKADIATDIE